MLDKFHEDQGELAQGVICRGVVIRPSQVVILCDFLLLTILLSNRELSFYQLSSNLGLPDSFDLDIGALH